MKVAIVVGHNSRAKGANSKAPLSTNEFDFYNKVADKMVSLAGSGIKAKRFNRTDVGSYSREIDKVYQEVDAFGAEISIELHYNSASPAAQGTETLTSGSTASSALAKAMQDSMLSVLELRDRGLKVRSSRDRGGRSLHAGRAPAILVEPFFGSNAKECRKVHELGVEGMAKMFLDGINTYAGIDEIADPPPNTVTPSGVFLVDVDILHSGLTKKQFFTKNKAAIKKIVKAVNAKLEAEAHGETINLLNNVDAFAIMNAEMGLKGSKVDAKHEHSLGEKGIFPLPGNLEYWNGPLSANLGVISPERNVKEFVLYLGNLKNKDIGKTFGAAGDLVLYRDLFTQEWLVNEPKKQMAVLAAAVHGYFYADNYRLGLPYCEISQKVAAAKDDLNDLLDLLSELGYKHAGENQNIIVNRVTNLKEGIGLA